MDGKKFTVTGTYNEKKEDKKFEKQITAVNEKYAMEKTLSAIGSKHKVKRNKIKITEVKKTE
ncbi:MAG: 50S ribosomal protein L18a [Candidatus Diapherotrites archaeon CG11_big_fil_rev_8_21_14_0_20_37_9]|nr:MAG: 50S ribosomal protein L18a [Candidatus Diapherotrites archaeon CG11_big_fil_rev_8_21_14_0_20_37_9]